MSRHEADVVILGGGSGGYAAGLRAAQRGASVVLIERAEVGGTCLHRGCVPTKALLHAAEIADGIASAEALGLSATLTHVDGARLRETRDRIVAGKYKGLQGLLSARGITVVTGDGRVTADRTVLVGEDEYAGKDLIVATGARSRELPFAPFGGRILDSQAALKLDVVPASVIVLGGGVIGVEFASAWRSLGAQVTVIESLDRLVAAEDPAASAALQRAFRKLGIDVRLGASVVEVAATDDGVTVTLDAGDALTADYLLVAVGRVPATEGLGLEDAGVALDRGFVVTDERLQTSVPHVWAVGDIVVGPQLAHRGFQHGLQVADRIAGEHPIAVPDSLVPRITYSHPEIASVGVSEAAAIEQFGAEAVKTVEYNLAGNAKSTILGTSGFVKVVRQVDGPVLGVTMVGDRVGELITEAQLVVGWEAHPEDVAPYLHAHPTQSEALGEAFLALTGRPLHAV